MAPQHNKFKGKKLLGREQESIYNRSVHACQVSTTREEFFFMNDVPAFVEHLKKLAQDYHDTHHSQTEGVRVAESIPFGAEPIARLIRRGKTGRGS